VHSATQSPHTTTPRSASGPGAGARDGHVLPSRRASRASIALLRAVMDERWRLDDAATRLLEQVAGHDSILLVLRARFSRSLLERPSPAVERAVATVNHALASLDAEPLTSFPRQVVRGA
jgi:hypothetical protein